MTLLALNWLTVLVDDSFGAQLTFYRDTDDWEHEPRPYHDVCTLYNYVAFDALTRVILLTYCTRRHFSVSSISMYQRASFGISKHQKTAYHELLLSAVGSVSMAKLIRLLIDLITDLISWFDY